MRNCAWSRAVAWVPPPFDGRNDGVFWLPASAPEGKRRVGGQFFRSDLLGKQLGPRCGGDHRGVVGGERERREGDGQAMIGGLGGEADAQLAIGRYSSGDEEAGRAELLGGAKGLAAEVVDDGSLEGGDEIQRLGIA